AAALIALRELVDLTLRTGTASNVGGFDVARLRAFVRAQARHFFAATTGAAGISVRGVRAAGSQCAAGAAVHPRGAGAVGLGAAGSAAARPTAARPRVIAGAAGTAVGAARTGVTAPGGSLVRA